MKYMLLIILLAFSFTQAQARPPKFKRKLRSKPATEKLQLEAVRAEIHAEVYERSTPVKETAKNQQKLKSSSVTQSSQAKPKSLQAQSTIEVLAKIHLPDGTILDPNKINISNKVKLDKFTKLEKQGNAQAMYELGYFYRHGYFPNDKKAAKLILYKTTIWHLPYTADYPKARIWFIKAITASQHPGTIGAMFELGTMYYYGQGVKKNLDDAFKWLKEAARKRHARAQYYTGMMYHAGLGVDKNYDLASQYLEQSAKQNNEAAQYMLGNIYYKGKGVTKNIPKAKHYFQQAANQGNLAAKEKIKKINQNEEWNWESVTNVLKKGAVNIGMQGLRLGLQIAF